jgi:hypothetical protein
MDFLTFLTKFIWPGIVFFILIKYRKQIGEFLTALKDWTKIVFPGGSVERENRESKITLPEPKVIVSEESPQKLLPEDKSLSPEATKVISTLWKHQQFYYTDHSKGRWSFGVGFANLLYRDYLVGVGELIKKGLVTISLSNGQCLLTDAGVNFCKENPNKLSPDWNFDRWSP